MHLRHTLSLSDCSTAIHAGLIVARANEWRVTIAVVDDGGHTLQLIRMDDASPASVDTAIQKARSAALTGLDTAKLEAMVRDRPAVMTIGRVAVEGGVPILHEGQRVGGIGVSGVQSHQDAEVAHAALDALKRELA
jgi:glc operon protein GlcG